jgi:integrase
VFGSLPVQAIDIGLVMKVVEPLWSKKPETGSRVRGRIETILDWATVRGYRHGENPATWRGRLDKLLPKLAVAKKAKRARTGRDEHHAALPYAELPAFMVELRKRDAVGAKAFEFAILTGARTAEVIGARWEEVDLAAKIWTVPAERMKGGREQRQPLSDAAIAVVERMRHRRENGFLFPGSSRDQLSNMAFLMLLRRMKRGDLTAHGFRATFKTWATERTNFQEVVIEAALAHVYGDKVEAAYQRGDLFDKRRRLLNAWGEYCGKAPAAGQVVTLRAAE